MAMSGKISSENSKMKMKNEEKIMKTFFYLAKIFQFIHFTKISIPVHTSFKRAWTQLCDTNSKCTMLTAIAMEVRLLNCSDCSVISFNVLLSHSR